MNKVLMVALDYPPCQSAGVQRTLHFKEYIERNGWTPFILTAKPHIYDRVNMEQFGDEHFFNSNVYRAWGWNALKHFSIKGKHFEFTTFPDRFSTWRWDGVRLGKKIIESHCPDVLWSTFPCSTSMRIGLELKKISGLPWVADFRDPFSGTNPYVRAKNPIGKKIDKQVIEHADRFVFTTTSAAEVYLKEYPFMNQLKISIIPNGFNERSFDNPKLSNYTRHHKSENRKFTVLHSGFLYPGGRNIESLVMALVKLEEESPEAFKRLKFLFRGATLSNKIELLLNEYCLEDKIFFEPSIPFDQSLSEMLEADALLVLQGEIFNNQIPGKVYEYIRTRKPIIALTHSEGATAKLCRNIPHACIADINDSVQIKQALVTLFDIKVESTFDPSSYNRDRGAEKLLEILNSLINSSVSASRNIPGSLSFNKLK